MNPPFFCYRSFRFGFLFISPTRIFPKLYSILQLFLFSCPTGNKFCYSDFLLFLRSHALQKKEGKKVEKKRSTCPTYGWYEKLKLSWIMYTLRTCFCTFGANVHAQLVLIDKITALELRRKSMISALLVGW